MRLIVRVLRYIREINSASFPFVVTGAVMFAFASLFARAWVDGVFSDNAWRLWAFFIVSIGAEVIRRVVAHLRSIRGDMSVGIASARDASRIALASVGNNAHDLSRVTWSIAQIMTSTFVRLVFRILSVIVVAVLHVFRATFVTTKTLTRIFLRVSPHALPFALVLLLAEFFPALPNALRMSANVLVTYMVICIAMAVVVAAKFSRKA